MFTGSEMLGSDAVLVMSEDRTVVDIVHEDDSLIECIDGILCPCLVNAHCHLELSHLKNVIPEKTGLPEFGKQIMSKRDAFQKEEIEAAIDDTVKIIFLCSPNNPTGNSLEREDIEIILNNFEGIVVLDEAYINYSRHRSFLAELNDYPNLVVMQTFSKAWGLAALRMGMTFASQEIIDVLNKIKPPYNINQSTQELVLKALENLDEVNAMTRETVKEREERRG